MDNSTPLPPNSSLIYDGNYEWFLVQKQDVLRYARKHRLTHLPISRQWQMCEDVSPWDLENAKYYYGEEWNQGF